MENCNFDKYILQELRECSRIECKFLAAALPRVKTTPSMELSQRRSDPLTNVPKSKKETNSSTSTDLNTNMLQWSRFPNPKKRQIIFILNTITATLINFCHKLPPSNCINLNPPLICAARIDFEMIVHSQLPQLTSFMGLRERSERSVSPKRSAKLFPSALFIIIIIIIMYFNFWQSTSTLELQMMI